MQNVTCRFAFTRCCSPTKVLRNAGIIVACLVAMGVNGRASPAAAQLSGGVNATLNASPSNAAVGQVVTFSYRASPPAVAPPFPSIVSIIVNYGDGSSDSGSTGGPGQTVTGVQTHVYSSPGTYTATLAASASSGESGSDFASVTVGGGGGQAPVVTVTASPSTASVGQTVSFSYSATTSFGIGFPTVRSMLISYGDGSAPLPLNPPNGTVTRSYSSPGFFNILVTATDSNGQQGQGTSSVQVVANANQPPTNVQILNPPPTATAGQPVSFNAATAAAVNPGAFIQNYAWSYGDGGIDNGQSVSHVFSAQGTYTVTLTVSDSTGATAQRSASITIQSSTPPPAPGVSVTYQPGWNLVAAPNGTAVPAAGPLYTFQNGDSAYRMSSTTQGGLGYWAFFNQPTTVTIPFAGPQTVTKALQPNQFVMIGNSSSSTATVGGADIVYTYSAVTSYSQSTTLQPGQGAWAFSFNGGNVTIVSPGP
ncbi:MAG TPA: PKD domain-containing protein [Dehalococcoidia bacterium]|nr:PKD domain-containing protein [Dehalococcoidia bacterium]